MRIFIELLDADAGVTRSAVFDGPLVMVGEGERNDFLVEGLDDGAVRIERGGRGLIVVAGGHARQVERTASIDVGGRTIRITALRQDAVPGACTRCGGSLGAAEVAGAYRSIARQEQRCSGCGVSVLAVDDAGWEIGAFSERARDEWVHVAVTMRCPRCLQPMMRVFFRTEAGEADVERCMPCGTVVIGPEDRARLAGA